MDVRVLLDSQSNTEGEQMTHTKDEALELALEALELSSVTVDSFGVQRKTQEAITAIKQALAAQPAPVPLTDENIDRIAYALTGFDGKGTQAMSIDEIRRIARAAARLTAAPEKGQP